MRILSIRCQNLASLEGTVELDFESGPLATTGLFAISGPTGAGKSTLLDAMCLALFGKTPRIDAERSPVKIPDGPGMTISAADVRQLLRRGAATGFAEVVFLGSDGLRYRARWSVRRANLSPSGKLQESVVELIRLDTQQPLGRNKEEVLPAIERALGLTFEQFRRSVLLAQGDFAAFLRAKADERAELLERMTGTELYGLVSKQAHARATEARKRLEMLEATLSALEVLDDAERAALVAQAAAQETAAATAGRMAEEARSRLSWWTRRDELSTLLADAETALLEAQKAWENAAERRTSAETLRTAEALCPLVEGADRARHAHEHAMQALARLDVQLVEVVAEEARRKDEEDEARRSLAVAREGLSQAGPRLDEARSLDRRVREKDAEATRLAGESNTARDQVAAAKSEAERLETELVGHVRACAEARDFLAAHPTDVRVAASWEVLAPQLQAYGRTLSEYRALTESLPALERTAEEAAQREEEARRSRAVVSEALAGAEKVVTEAESLERAVSAEALAERRRTANAARSVLEALERSEAAAVLVEAARTKCETDALGSAETAAGLRTESAACIASLAEVARQLAEQEALQVRLGLAAHRARLVDGEPCPLCGALEHPGVAAIDATAELLSAQRRDLEARRKALEAKKSEADGSAMAAAMLASRMRSDAQAHAEELRRHVAEWSTVVARVGANGPTSPLEASAASWLETRRRVVEAEEQSVRDEEERVRGLVEASRAARRSRDEARANCATADDEWGTRRQEAQAASRAADDAMRAAARCRSQLDEGVAALSPTFGPGPDWRHAIEADALVFFEQWEARARAVREHQTLVQTGDGLVADATRGRNEAKLAVTLAERTHQELKERSRTLVAEIGTLRHQRALLFGGRDTESVEREFRDSVTAQERLLEAASALHRTAMEHRAVLLGSIEAERASLEKLAVVHAESIAARDAALAASGLELVAVRACLAVDEATREGERAALESIDRVRAESLTRAGERRRDLSTHDGLGRPEDPADVLTMRLREAEATLHEESLALGASREKLRRDDRARAESAERQSELDAGRREVQLLESLNHVIGSSDGKKLRVFAQSLTLDMLLAHANVRLAELAPRYRLQRMKNTDLELQVLDRDMGDEVRAVTGLSGGETFLVSLALALGLSSLASRRVQIDSLFIDEGFGTLDPETLEVALATLDSLQAAGRKVGLISHVQGLAERIGVQVLVEKHGGGRSTVRVAGRVA